MAASVIIGRKELFAFANRYASHRMRDYSDLADGDVLCRLFSLVFPRLALLPAAAQTHSLTQRTLANWEGLYRSFARVHIPLVLLDPLALARNDATAGFSTLVLFYFLFQLSKKTDFSAEFAMDVSEELTAFLQSIDSIASLLLGEAVEWEAIPEELGDVIRQQQSFHVSPGEQEALEENAAKQCRSLLCPAPSASGAAASKLGPRRGHRLVPPQSSPSGAAQTSTERRTQASATEGNAAVVSSLSSPDRTVSERSSGEPVNAPVVPRARAPHADKSLASRSSAAGEEGDDTSVCSRRSRDLPPRPHPVLTGLEPRHEGAGQEEAGNTQQQQQQQQFSEYRLRFLEKAKECEGLRGSNIQLLAQVASLESELAHTQRQKAEAQEKVAELAEAVNTLAAELQASHEQLRTLAEQNSHQARQQEQQQRHLEYSDPQAQQGTRSDSCGSEHHSVDNDDVAAADSAIDALLEDVVDPNTGKPLDAHELANLLHCALLEHMQDAPINRGQAQEWLWAIVTAYHVLEGRLVDAVDTLEALRQRLRDRPHCPHGCTHPSHGAHSDGPAADPQQHEVEHQLRQLCYEQKYAFHALATSAAAREETWRRLAAALHEAEQLSCEAACAAMSDPDNVAELEAVMREREDPYRRIEELTDELQRRVLPKPSASAAAAAAAVDGPCWAVQRIAERALASKDAAERQLRELKAAIRAGAIGEQPKGHGAAAAAQTPSSSERLSTPLPLNELTATRLSCQSGSPHGSRTLPKVVAPRSDGWGSEWHRRHAGSAAATEAPSCSPLSSTSSPYGKSLAALLAEATSPYDELISAEAALA